MINKEVDVTIKVLVPLQNHNDRKLQWPEHDIEPNTSETLKWLLTRMEVIMYANLTHNHHIIIEKEAITKC